MAYTGTPQRWGPPKMGPMKLRSWHNDPNSALYTPETGTGVLPWLLAGAAGAVLGAAVERAVHPTTFNVFIQDSPEFVQPKGEIELREAALHPDTFERIGGRRRA